jgi:hypothetical protein
MRLILRQRMRGSDWGRGERGKGKGTTLHTVRGPRWKIADGQFLMALHKK